jgi:hypothetical protein
MFCCSMLSVTAQKDGEEKCSDVGRNRLDGMMGVEVDVEVLLISLHVTSILTNHPSHLPSSLENNPS